MTTARSSVYYDSAKRQLICRGDWDLAHLPQRQAEVSRISWPHSGEVSVNGAAIEKLDSAGAWFFIQLQKNLKQKGVTLKFTDFRQEPTELIGIVEKTLADETPLPQVSPPGQLAIIGAKTINVAQEVSAYLSFVGALTFEFLRLLPSPKHWRWNSLSNVLYTTGYQGLPIIALLSFLIGVVLTYQMGLQLRNYGADIYIVDLLGLSVLREFAPLITAIMVSGRTGSAFTASIGMMKLNQEIDALDTMGVTPAELLLLPRIIGLFIALPLLTMWSDIFGVLGGMVMSNNMLGITWYDFLHRFQRVVSLKSFLIGMGKAPVFALLIASIGCFEGMQVKYSADSVGQNTTRSVVAAIFFIIVTDAIFSVLLSKMHL